MNAPSHPFVGAVADIDVSDATIFLNDTWPAYFAKLRAEDPVHFTENELFGGFWSVTRHADILAANGAPDVFSSAQGIRIEDQTHEEYLARRTFQETDPPEHRITRKMVNPAFSRPAMLKYESLVREMAGEVLDEALAHPEIGRCRDHRQAAADADAGTDPRPAAR